MKYRHMCVMGWFVVALVQLFAIKGAAESAFPSTAVVQRSAAADFRGELASESVQRTAEWAIRSADNQGLPFVVVDKVQARVFVFNSDGHLLGKAPALLGLTRGDDAVAGIGERPLSRIRINERTTPSGRFVASLARNISGQEILWVDYDQGISMHPVRSVDPKERRMQRLASPTANDNRISYGCINVSVHFWHKVVVPTFTGTQGIVYVLPESRPLPLSTNTP
jgi:hypothetical protein